MFSSTYTHVLCDVDINQLIDLTDMCTYLLTYEILTMVIA